MAIKPYTIKNYNGADWDVLHPQTGVGQVIESADRQFISATEKASISTKLNASAYTAADVLAKVKTVDGAGSGLDADTLDGLQATAFLQPSSSLDATKLTGVIPIASMPPAALERLHVVANQAARFALTTATAQVGDTVKETDTGKMFYVKDDTKLSSAAGYEEYSAGSASSVPWGGITGKPTTVATSGLTDAATKAVVTSSADGLMRKEDKAKLDIISKATAVPKVNGTAAIGASNEYATSDHVHPLQPSAATLTTARTFAIKDGVTGTATSFNGSANISIPVTSINATYIKTGTIPNERLSVPIITSGTTAPTTPKVGDLWFDFSNA